VRSTTARRAESASHGDEQPDAELGELGGQPYRKTIGVAKFGFELWKGRGAASLLRTDITEAAGGTDQAGISAPSPAADVKRTANDKPYTTAVVRPWRRDVIANRLRKFVPSIALLFG
jgi:hypothetical protein